MKWALWGFLLAIVLPLIAVTLIVVVVSSLEFPEELRNAPPLIVEERKGDFPALGQAGVRPARPSWDKPAPPADFAEYLEFRRAYDPKGAVSLYLELEPMLISKEFQENVYELFGNSPEGWKSGLPLNADQKKWLMENRPLIGQLRLLARAGGLPMLSQEEIKAVPDEQLYQLPMPRWQLATEGSRILEAEAARLAETGDIDGAIELLLEIPLLMQEFRDTLIIGKLVDYIVVTRTNDGIVALLQKGSDSDPATMDRLRAELSRHAGYVSMTRFPLEMNYRATRGFAVQMLTAPLPELIAMDFKMRSSHGGIFPPEEYEAWGLIQDGMRRPLDLASSFYSSLKMKTNAASSLRKYDEYWRGMFETVNMPFRELPESMEAPLAEIDPFNRFVPNLRGAFDRSFRSQVKINLNRTAVEWLAGGTQVFADPMSGEPLRVVEEADSILIYSVGEDLIDQQGASDNDPANDLPDGDDLSIRVPRRPVSAP